MFLISPLTVPPFDAQPLTLHGQVSFSLADHASAMASVMEIQKLFSSLTCHENSLKVVFSLHCEKKRLCMKCRSCPVPLDSNLEAFQQGC